LNRYWLPLALIVLHATLALAPRITDPFGEMSTAVLMSGIVGLFLPEVLALSWAVRGHLDDQPRKRLALRIVTWFSVLPAILGLLTLILTWDVDLDVAVLIWAMWMLFLLAWVGLGGVAMLVIAVLGAMSASRSSPPQ
jgi:hypothetical protein